MAELREGLTWGELLGPAMEMTDQAEADAYYESMVDLGLREWPQNDDGTPRTRADAEAVVRSNLGYYAGYYSDETRARVERLFRCAHPVFGSIQQNGPPTPEEAFEAGRQAVSHDD